MKKYEPWGNSDSRIMGRGFEISGKHSNWSEACKSLLKILSAPKTVSQTKLDNIVKQEIDRLAALKIQIVALAFRNALPFLSR